MSCQCGRRSTPWGFYASLVLAAVCLGFVLRTAREYRAVHELRVAGDSLLTDWMAKKCVPK